MYIWKLSASIFGVCLNLFGAMVHIHPSSSDGGCIEKSNLYHVRFGAGRVASAHSHIHAHIHTHKHGNMVTQTFKYDKIRSLLK